MECRNVGVHPFIVYNVGVCEVVTKRCHARPTLNVRMQSESTVYYIVASSPGPEKRAWYTLTAHASVLTQNPGKNVNHTVYFPYTIT